MAAVPAAAQPTPRGTDGSFPAVARVRGVGAAVVNPAALALPGGSPRELLLPSPSARLSLAPVGPGDWAEWGGRDVPRSVRERWLREVEAHGGENGRASASLTWAAGRRGPLGLHVTTTLGVRARLDADAAELLLFGNAGRTGEPRLLTPDGSSLDAWALTRAAVSGASTSPLRLGAVEGTLAVGAALGVTVGHGLVVARDAGTRVGGGDASVEVAFPRLETDGALDPAGWGVGVDLGAVWQGGPWSLGAVLTEAVSTFRWSREALRHRSGRGAIGGDDGGVEASPAVPRVLLDALDAAVPAPVLLVEAARRVTPRMVVSAGARTRLRPGLGGRGGAVGATLSWLAAPGLTVQGGVAAVEGGPAVSAGGRTAWRSLEAFGSVEWDGGGPRGLALGVSLALPGSPPPG